MNHLVCLDDFEKEAEKRLSKTAFGYFQGAADDQQTATDNRAAFSRLVYVMYVCVHTLLLGSQRRVE